MVSVTEERHDMTFCLYILPKVWGFSPYKLRITQNMLINSSKVLLCVTVCGSTLFLLIFLQLVEMDHSMHNMDHMDHSHHEMQMVPSTVPQATHDHSAHLGASIGQSDDSMDHSSHHSMMMMSFHFGCQETVLFDWWTFSTASGLIGSMIGIFIMAALYEGLKYYREYLFWRTYNSLFYKNVQTPVAKNSVTTEDNRVVQPSILSANHFLQTFLHIIQVVVSYFLMLIFMTFNVWLCLAVVLGAACGYFLFGWKKSVIVDVTEHCH